MITKAVNKTEINKIMAIVEICHKHLQLQSSIWPLEGKQTLHGKKIVPHLLTLAISFLLLKNKDSYIAKNYQPIISVNITFKVFITCSDMVLTLFKMGLFAVAHKCEVTKSSPSLKSVTHILQ